MIESKPQNSIELNRNIELTIQNQELQLAKHKAEIAAQKLNLFCDLSPIGHYLTDCDGKIVELNSSGLALLDKTADDLLNFTFSQFITKKHLSITISYYKSKRNKYRKFLRY
jgi:PAS domain-containing protein